MESSEKPPPSNRELKRIVARLLQQDDRASLAEALGRIPARRIVNPLFSLFCSPTPLVRWRAVTTMGAVVSGLADVDPESARVVMRRFMWNLNEESGGIGWGCPEAMGETMARHPRLAKEYACILISYLNPEGNFIDHPALQEGVLWGFGRLAEANPSAVGDAAGLLEPFLSDEAPALRGLAVWAAGCSVSSRLTQRIETLTEDSGFFEMYAGERLVRRSVGQLAR